MNDAAEVRLPARARLADAEALLDSLKAVRAAPDLVVDAGAVEETSTACVTVLIIAARERAEAGLPFALRAPTPALVDAFSDLGLFQDLMKMEFRT